MLCIAKNAGGAEAVCRAKTWITTAISKIKETYTPPTVAEIVLQPGALELSSLHDHHVISLGAKPRSVQID